MKRFLSLLLTFTLLFTLSACGGESTKEPPAQDEQLVAGLPVDGQSETLPEAPKEPFPGKIAIITNTIDCNEEEYRSAEEVIAKYGEDKIVHRTWPVNFMQEQEQMIKVVVELAEDPNIKALIFNQAVMGSNPAVDKLHETRDDMFIAYCLPAENPPDISARANLILTSDEVAMGPAMVKQAKKMGATKFAHYSFPRHMSMPLLSDRREEIIKTCAEEGLEYIDLTAPDPAFDYIGAQQFILDDIPKKVARYGKDTAFFATNCAMQIPLIEMVVKTGAIYPQPCDPSPYHGFPAALSIENSFTDEDWNYQMRGVNDVIDEINRIVDENNMGGRLSTWPVPVSMMSTNASVEYAIKWINGEVPKEGIDVAVFEKCMADYAGVDCPTRAYVDTDGTEYSNYLMVREDYITFGENSIKGGNSASTPDSSENAFTRQGDFLIKDGELIEYCGNDSDVIIPNSITSIASWTFLDNKNLRSVTMPAGLKYIGESAFYGCSNLQSVNIPRGVTVISAMTFDGCESLKSITIPNSVTSIGSYAFSGCTALKSVTIPNGVTSIGGAAFYGCDGLKSVTIPNSITSIGLSAFEGCNSLKSVTIPDSVTSIGEAAFRECNSIKSVTIPKGVTSIEDYTFKGCYDLEKVVIPSGATSIGNSVFKNCKNLKSITIPDGVTLIKYDTFAGCANLQSVTIPSSVTSIGSSAFEGCTGLTSITIPNSVTYIGSTAFYRCESLNSVTIPEGITSIEISTFNSCTALKTVTIPKSVTNIGWGAFRGCTGLKSVTIPSSVTTIEEQVFLHCNNLTIDCPAGSEAERYAKENDIPYVID